MIQDELELSDLELLMKALDALNSRSALTGVMGTMLGVMMSRDEEQVNRTLRNAEQHELKRQREQELLAERIILVKAKLIRLKDRAVVEGELT